MLLESLYKNESDDGCLQGANLFHREASYSEINKLQNEKPNAIHELVRKFRLN